MGNTCGVRLRRQEAECSELNPVLFTVPTPVLTTSALYEATDPPERSRRVVPLDAGTPTKPATSFRS